jgi:hypothetical protein
MEALLLHGMSLSVLEKEFFFSILFKNKFGFKKRYVLPYIGALRLGLFASTNSFLTQLFHNFPKLKKKSIQHYNTQHDKLNCDTHHK